jgi:DNA-binding MurR/RpiR family transcriptional regulator
MPVKPETLENAAPGDYEALKALLVARRETMPRRLAQVATFALDQPDEIAFGTVASVAALSGVQPSTLVRFAQALGYAGFSDLQEVFRAQMRARWPDYRDRLAQLRGGLGEDHPTRALLSGFAASGALSLERLATEVAARDVERAAALMAAADCLHILGLRRAFPVASYLAYALGKLGFRHMLVDNVAGLAPEQLAGARDGDALIAISFTPYTPATVELTMRAAGQGLPVIAITDSPFSPLAPHAAVSFEVVEADFAGFRSLAASMSLAMTLAVAAGGLRGGG